MIITYKKIRPETVLYCETGPVEAVWQTRGHFGHYGHYGHYGPGAWMPLFLHRILGTHSTNSSPGLAVMGKSYNKCLPIIVTFRMLCI